MAFLKTNVSIEGVYFNLTSSQFNVVITSHATCSESDHLLHYTQQLFPVRTNSQNTDAEIFRLVMVFVMRHRPIMPPNHHRLYNFKFQSIHFYWLSDKG